jgi:hypothetical protein
LEDVVWPLEGLTLVVQKVLLPVGSSAYSLTKYVLPLLQRTKEIREVANILESLDHGLLTQGSNVATGKTKLNVASLLNRLDLSHLAVGGHSFGGATAVLASTLDNRFKCCLGLDVWWEPMESQRVMYSSLT